MGHQLQGMSQYVHKVEQEGQKGLLRMGAGNVGGRTLRIGIADLHNVKVGLN